MLPHSLEQLRTRFNSSQRSSQIHRSARSTWSVNTLESRLMLAGDVVTCAENLSCESAEPEAVSSNHVCSTVLFIDSAVVNIAELQQQLSQDGQDVELVLLDPAMDGVRQVTQHLAQRRHVA
ncbi:MAG: DUF4347 domain-containing protein, partial [Planctomycetales bacterium]|nr:DUF4347 domain-containing protein [Planctomycetales bacterium]